MCEIIPSLLSFITKVRSTDRDHSRRSSIPTEYFLIVRSEHLKQFPFDRSMWFDSTLRASCRATVATVSLAAIRPNQANFLYLLDHPWLRSLKQLNIFITILRKTPDHPQIHSKRCSGATCIGSFHRFMLGAATATQYIGSD